MVAGTQLAPALGRLPRKTWVLVQTGLPTCCVTWSKLLSLSEPEFYHVKSSHGEGLLGEKGLTWGSAL